MDYRTTILHLTQLWSAGTPTSRRAFDQQLTIAMRKRDAGPLSPRGYSMGGGSLEHLVWDAFFSMLADSEYQDSETVTWIASLAGHKQPYVRHAYISYDLRPDMNEAQRAIWEAADAYLRAVQDQDYLLHTERGDLDARWQRLVNDWRALPHAERWKRRTVCDEVLRQVFNLLICQILLPGGRGEIWPRGSYKDMVDRGETSIPRQPNLLPLIPWGQRALGACMGRDLVQLSWRYEKGHITFCLI